MCLDFSKKQKANKFRFCTGEFLCKRRNKGYQGKLSGLAKASNFFYLHCAKKKHCATIFVDRDEISIALHDHDDRTAKFRYSDVIALLFVFPLVPRPVRLSDRSARLRVSYDSLGQLLWHIWYLPAPVVGRGERRGEFVVPVTTLPHYP